MSRLIDADELLKEINIWCDCVDGACLLKDAPTVKAIPLDKVKQAREEIEQNAYPIVHGVNNHDMGMTLNGIFQVLDDLVESEG